MTLKILWIFIKKYATISNSFLVNDTAFQSDNALRFRCNLFDAIFSLQPFRCNRDVISEDQLNEEAEKNWGNKRNGENGERGKFV